MDDNNPNTRPALEFALAMKDAKESLQSELQQLERLVVAPTIDFIALLDIIKRYLVKRSHKLLDYDRYGDSLKSMREKQNRTSSDEKKLSQMEATFDQASRDYNSINSLLKSELAIVLGLRKDFIDPCLLTFYNYQVRVYETLYRIYYQVGSTQFDLSTNALSGYQHVQEELINTLNSLSVCRGIAKPVGLVGHGVEGSSTTSQSVSSPSYSQQLAGQTSMTGSLTPVAAQQTRQSYDDPSTRPLSAGPNISSTRPTKMKSYVVALYDFEPQAEGDLGFRKDDKIEVTERKEDVNDWWTGRIGDRVGSFPGNYTAPF